jgi:transcription elongation factor GreA
MNILITKNTLDKKQQELRNLQIFRKTVLADMEEARSQGDLRENFGYHAAAELLRQTDQRLAEAASELQKPFTQIDPKTWLHKEYPTVTIGAVVTFTKDNGRPQPPSVYLIGGYGDEHQMVMPYTAPIIQPLLNHKVGDTVTAIIAKLPTKITVTNIQTPTQEMLDLIYPNQNSHHHPIERTRN